MTETQTILKASDLRIGNWVNVIKIHPIQITADHIKSIADGDQDYSYIPLTPEILEKAGFRNTIDGWEITDDKDRGLIIGFQENGTTDPWIYILSNYQSLEFKRLIQYLHQLQNLYHSLTGTELEIDL